MIVSSLGLETVSFARWCTMIFAQLLVCVLQTFCNQARKVKLQLVQQSWQPLEISVSHLICVLKQQCDFIAQFRKL